jgi:phosphoglycerate dehydrogenase-like enzyme
VNVLIGVISPAAAWTLPRACVELLRREFPKHTFLEAWNRDTIRRLLPDADVAFTPFIDRDIFPTATRLCWVQSPAVGVGHFLYPELVDSPVVVTSARGVRARAMAEHVIGVTFALARQLPTVFRHQAAHHWALDEIEESAKIVTLRGRRMALIGFGAIATEVVPLAVACGLRVSAVRRRASDVARESGPASLVDDVLPPEALPALVERSDIVVVAAPLTPETRHLVNRDLLDRFKPGSFLINVSRGKLIDDDALVEALRSGRLAGAALDVFTREPLDLASPYWDLPNVIVTPHISGAMEDYWTPLVALFADNLRRLEAGHPLLNVVDKKLGY